MYLTVVAIVASDAVARVAIHADHAGAAILTRHVCAFVDVRLTSASYKYLNSKLCHSLSFYSSRSVMSSHCNSSWMSLVFQQFLNVPRILIVIGHFRVSIMQPILLEKSRRRSRVTCLWNHLRMCRWNSGDDPCTWRHWDTQGCLSPWRSRPFHPHRSNLRSHQYTSTCNMATSMNNVHVCTYEVCDIKMTTKCKKRW